jgi:hypothetical protein
MDPTKEQRVWGKFYETMQRSYSGSSLVTTAGFTFIKAKSMLIIFFESKGIVHGELVLAGRRVNSA